MFSIIVLENIALYYILYSTIPKKYFELKIPNFCIKNKKKHQLGMKRQEFKEPLESSSQRWFSYFWLWLTSHSFIAVTRLSSHLNFFFSIGESIDSILCTRFRRHFFMTFEEYNKKKSQLRSYRSRGFDDSLTDIDILGNPNIKVSTLLSLVLLMNRAKKFRKREHETRLGFRVRGSYNANFLSPLEVLARI